MYMLLHRAGDKLYLNPPGAAGKTVEVAPSYHEQAERLANAAIAGDFYAITAINHLRALTTGFAGKHNVFISDSGSFRANTYQEVQIYVPNIVATVERRDDDKLLINRIELSPEFGNLEAAKNNKPGKYTYGSGVPVKDSIENCKSCTTPGYILENNTCQSDQSKKITKQEVQKAHAKIQKKIHPDISPETSRLSSIVNEAKEVVLKDLS